MRRSIWPRLYCRRSTRAERADALAEGVYSSPPSVAWKPAPAGRERRRGRGVSGRAVGGRGSRRLPGDRGGQVAELEDRVGQAGLRDRARHPVDGAGGLGLDEDRPAGGLDGLARRAGRRGPCRSARPAAGGRRQAAAASSMVRSARGRRPPSAASSLSSVRRSSARRRCEPPGRDAARRRVERLAAGGLADRAACDEPSRRVASEAVKPGGMCWTISVPAPRRRGQRGHQLAEGLGAAGRAGDHDELRGADGRARRAGAGVRRHRRGARPPPGRRAIAGRGARRPRPACAASATLRPSSAVNVSMRSPIAGLATRSKAPLGEGVHGAGAVGGGEGGDHHDRDRRRPCRRAARGARRCRPGPACARSSVSASGRCCAAERERLVAVRGAADDLEALARRGRRTSIRRMRRESSATTTRRFLESWWSPRPCGPSAATASSTSSPAGEQALRVQEDDQAVARSWRWPRSCRGWRSGRPRAARS